MIVVNATIKTTEENIANLKQALRTMELASQAEDGCFDYTFSVELNDPTRLRITERWENADALQAHFQTPHMATFQAAIAAGEATDTKVFFFDATEITPPGR